MTPATWRATSFSLSAGSFERSVLEQAATQALVPWEDWLYGAWCRVGTSKAYTASPVRRWKTLKPKVLEALAELGATVTVLRTDETVLLEEHLADVAGLVRVELDGAPRLQREPVGAFEQRMLADHGLRRAELPATLRGLCGQVSGCDDHRDPLSWTSMMFSRVFDHAHAWLDAEGLPVVSVEPSSADPVSFVESLNALAAPLPIVVDAPHPGVWSERTLLALLRVDIEREPVGSVWEPEADLSLNPLPTAGALGPVGSRWVRENDTDVLELV